MAMMYAKANSIAKTAKKYAMKMAENSEEGDYKDMYEKYFEMQVQLGIKEHLTTMSIFTRLEEATAEYLSDKKQWYFITVRPDESKIEFEDFFKKVSKFLSRACIEDYHASVEQKGTDDESLGKGFHLHAVVKAKWRSKSECLRDTQSTFLKCTAPNCVKVITTKNPLELVQNYLIEYKSDDGHKEVTKAWDKIWRDKLGLAPSYSRGDNPLTGILADTSGASKAPLPLSSTGNGKGVVIKWG